MNDVHMAACRATLVQLGVTALRLKTTILYIT